MKRTAIIAVVGFAAGAFFGERGVLVFAVVGVSVVVVLLVRLLSARRRRRRIDRDRIFEGPPIWR